MTHYPRAEIKDFDAVTAVVPRSRASWNKSLDADTTAVPRSRARPEIIYFDAVTAAFW